VLREIVGEGHHGFDLLVWLVGQEVTLFAFIAAACSQRDYAAGRFLMIVVPSRLIKANKLRR